MLNNKKLNGKILTTAIFATLSLILMEQKNTNISASQNPYQVSVDYKTHESSSATQNMLNTDSAILTDTSVSNISIVGNQITTQFANLPDTGGLKIIGVLVDSIFNGEVAKEFLSGNTVTFQNVPEVLKVPEIHLYRQGEGDPALLLRPENFISKTSFSMPYVKNVYNNGGLTPQAKIPTLDSSGVAYSITSTDTNYVSPCTLNSTFVPNAYKLVLPSDYLTTLGAQIGKAAGLTANQLMAVIIEQDNLGNKILEHNVDSIQVASSTDLCYFPIKLSDQTSSIQVHFYANGLLSENFLSKLFINITKSTPTSYGWQGN